MCDHCRSFKPLLEGASTTTYYRDKPKIIDATPTRPRTDNDNTGCCSWRQTCCDGGCCSRVGNCCSSESEARYGSSEKPTPIYGYGYGQPATSSLSFGMTGARMPDRVPCVTRKEKKLPMCFGGDCHDSPECTGKTNSNVGENHDTESIPRQSER